jgi:hypothetical protein
MSDYGGYTHDRTAKHVPVSCAVCSKPSTSVCSKCKGRSYCGRKCQALEWPEHKKVCKESRSDHPDAERPLFIVLEGHGEGLMKGFFDLRKAEKHAIKTRGDIRRPCNTERVEPGLVNYNPYTALPDASTAASITIIDHPCYMRPVSATADFFVRGRPSTVQVVVAGDSGCIQFVAAVFAGANAEELAQAEVEKRYGEDGVDLANGLPFGSEWVAFTVSAS